MDLKRYITCITDCDLKYVEALSMVGLVVDVKTEKCDKESFWRLVVRLFNGELVTSRCYYEEEVKHSSKVIAFYIHLARQKDAIGKLEIVELPEESD